MVLERLGVGTVSRYLLYHIPLEQLDPSEAGNQRVS
jgi:hypothetical protein